MPSRDSRSEYEARMHRVVEHVDRHLDEPLDLATLARVAHFSPFHFHRLFAAWMGQTLGDYIRRRRVEIAAMRFAAQPRVTVLDVALSVGFGSAEALARAFRHRFGCAPTTWRRQQRMLRHAERNPGQAKRNSGQVKRNPGQAAPAPMPEHRGFPPLAEEIPMNVRLVDRPPVAVACLRHLGPYGEPVSRFWEHAYYPWAVTHGLLGHARYGISHDDPGITAPDQCRYDACAEVPEDFVAAGGAFKTTLPGGRYAVYAFRGGVADIVGAWTALLRDWLPSSGLQLDARPCFEHYPVDANCDPGTGAFACEICIPVAPL